MGGMEYDGAVDAGRIAGTVQAIAALHSKLIAVVISPSLLHCF